MTRLHPAPLLLAAALCGLALILAALWWPDIAGAGWVAGFVFVAGIPIGSLGWLLIHRLTDGRWGTLLAPAFRPSSMLLPALAILAIPLLVSIPALSPWTHASAVLASSVSTLYLNTPSFVARTVIVLFGLTMFALLLPESRGRGTIFGALGLIFYGVAMTFAGVDWILALEPPFMSTSVGVTIIATQLLSALAFAVLTACPEEEVGRRDLAGLLLALCLAVLYLDYMALVVLWYGDVPAKIFWLDRRVASPWWWLTVLAMLLGTVIPSLALMIGPVRGHRLALQIVAAVTLTGLALHDAILVVPKFGAVALATSAIASVGVACLLLALLVTPWPQRLRRRAEATHG